VTFALLGLPLVIATTFVIDYAAAETEKTNVKSALDVAVLAAANNNILSLSEKEAYAVTHFNQNYKGSLEFDLTPKASSGHVEMSAFGLAPVTVSEVLGIEGIEIYEKSAASLSSQDVVCVLALAPTGIGIYFKGNARFSAPACSVQSNSTDAKSLRSEVSTYPTAKSFCSSGGASGEFGSVVKSECRPIADPYENLVLPAELEGDEGCLSVDTVKGSGTLYLGIYCEGLKFDQAKYDLKPGIYVIRNKELVITGDGTNITGTGVTFVLDGDDVFLKMDNASRVNLTAPGEGEPTAGLVFWHRSKAASKSGKTTEISASADVRIVGTAYFPKQHIDIKSDKSIASKSPATSIIAYSMEFSDNTNIIVNVDHETGGIPPLLPRSDEAVRLVK